MKSILYVDDEEQALKYFRKNIGGDFPVFTASDGDFALRFLEENAPQVSVLLVDQRMPGKSGL